MVRKEDLKLHYRMRLMDLKKREYDVSYDERIRVQLQIMYYERMLFDMDK